MSRRTIRSRTLAIRRACGLALLLATATAVHAQGAPDDTAAQAVEVHGIRNPALMPYRKAYDLVTGIDGAAGHRVQLRVRVTSAESDKPLPDLELRLVGENTHAHIPVSPAGYVDLPLDRGAYDDAADIVANKAMKTLTVGIFVLPRFEPGEIRYADVVDTVSKGRAAIAQIVPWYLRLLLPTLHGVAVCYPAAGQSVAFSGHEDTPRPATVEDKDMENNTVFCARFSGKETAFAGDSLLVAPEGWQALFW